MNLPEINLKLSEKDIQAVISLFPKADQKMFPQVSYQEVSGMKVVERYIEMMKYFAYHHLLLLSEKEVENLQHYMQNELIKFDILVVNKNQQI